MAELNTQHVIHLKSEVSRTMNTSRMSEVSVEFLFGRLKLREVFPGHHHLDGALNRTGPGCCLMISTSSVACVVALPGAAAVVVFSFAGAIPQNRPQKRGECLFWVVPITEKAAPSPRCHLQQP